MCLNCRYYFVVVFVSNAYYNCVCVCVCRSEVDPDSALQEADARRLFEGMLQALSDVRKRERETHTHTHTHVVSFLYS